MNKIERDEIIRRHYVQFKYTSPMEKRKELSRLNALRSDIATEAAREGVERAYDYETTLYPKNHLQACSAYLKGFLAECRLDRSLSVDELNLKRVPNLINATEHEVLGMKGARFSIDNHYDYMSLL